MLKAHALMMAGLTPEARCFRGGNAGVFREDRLIHAGTPAAYVPEMMAQLFDRMRSSKLPLLLTACIFHYEFEFIHPFADGNGRTGRLWHALLPQRWKPFFAWLPVETLIRERQKEHYAALNAANSSGQSTVFAAFMLSAIRAAFREPQNGNVGENVGENSIRSASCPLRLSGRACFCEECDRDHDDIIVMKDSISTNNDAYTLPL